MSTGKESFHFIKFQRSYIEPYITRKVAQGIVVLVSPVKYEDDDAQELENLRAKYMRKIKGKIKNGNVSIQQMIKKDSLVGKIKR